MLSLPISVSVWLLLYALCSGNNCLTYFSQVVCEVTTDTGYTLDLSPLVKTSGKYNVLQSYGNLPSGMIYINLCRPLNPIFGVLCPAGSGACLVREGQKPLVITMFLTLANLFYFFCFCFYFVTLNFIMLTSHQKCRKVMKWSCKLI